MPRYAKSNVTINDLKQKIESYECGVYEILNEDVAPKVVKDLSKIDVDSENAGLIDDFDMPGAESLPQYEMLGDFPVAWCGCGGDWQCPLIFVLYIGDDGGLRAYIPSKGNVYDHKNKCAYDGNCQYKFDTNLLKEDIKNRIQVKGGSQSSGLYSDGLLKSLKGYIWDDEDEDWTKSDLSSTVFCKFIEYICKNFKLPHDLEETESTESYDDAWTFEDTDDWMYIIFGKGSKNEGNDGLTPYLLIHNKDEELIFEKDFKDMKEFAEYLDQNKDKLGKIIQEVSESF